MKLLFVAFINETHKQLLRKINDQYKAFKFLNYETNCLVIGAGGFKIDFSLYDYEYVNIDKLRGSSIQHNDRELSFQILNNHLKNNDYDIIYFRYPFSDLHLYEFVKKHPNIVFEHHANELKQMKMSEPEQYNIEKKYGSAVLSKILGIVAGTTEIIEFEKSRIQKSLPTLLMTNGVNLEEIPPIKHKRFDGTYNFVFLSNNTQQWQGIDRIIEGLKTYDNKNKIKIHMFGKISDSYIDMIKAYGLEENFIFWGYKEGKDIDEIINYCHAGIGVLGVHRKGLRGVPVLKHREYALRGLPFIYSGYDPDFTEDLPFTYIDEANDEPVDISNIVKLADKLVKSSKFSQEIRKFAKKNLTWKKKKIELLEFLKTLLQNNNILIKNYNIQKREQYKNFKKITFFAGDNNHFHFAEDIMKYLRDENYIVEKIFLNSPTADEIYFYLRNTDVAWFEWGIGPIEIASNLPKTCRIICRIHKYEIYRNSINKINWKNIDDLIFISPHIYEDFKELQNHNIDELTNVHVVKNSVKLDEIPFVQKERGYNIAFIARFHGAKNPSLMLQILKQLVDIDPRYKIHMIGSIQDITEYKYTMYLAEQLGVKNNFIYEGKIDNVFEWLKDKSYILSTSIIEGLPVNILEAMAAGCKPIIHNYFANSAEIFGEKYIFNQVNEAIELITSDDFNSNEYRRVIEKNYNFESTVKRFEEIINSNRKVETEVIKIPFFTVGIIATNHDNWLSTIKSALDLNYNNYEILICSESSITNSIKQLKNLNIPKLKLIDNLSDSKANAMNAILENAKGDFIIWIDDKTILSNNVLEILFQKTILYPNIDLFYSNIIIENVEKLTRTEMVFYDWFGKGKEFKNILINNFTWPITGLITKTALLQKYDGFDLATENYCLIDLIYRGIINNELSVKLIEQAIFRYNITENAETETVISLEYKVALLDEYQRRFSLKELFPHLDWLINKDVSQAEALFSLGIKYLSFGDANKAGELFTNSLAITNPTSKQIAVLRKFYPFATQKQKAEILNFVSVDDKLEDEIDSLDIGRTINSNNLKISICIPTYNRDKFLRKTIESALEQDYDNYEIIILDDGSTDETENIIESFLKNDKVKYFKKEHTNAPDTRNRLIDLATGDYILWLDSDDNLYPNVFSKYVDTLVNYPTVNMVYGNIRFTDFNGNEHGISNYTDWYNNQKELRSKIISGQPFPNPFMLIKKSLYNEVGNYNVDFIRAHDYEFNSRLVTKADINMRLINEVIGNYIIHDENLTTTKTGEINTSYEIKILDSLVKLPLKTFFPNLDWHGKESESNSIAFAEIALQYKKYNSYEKTIQFYKKSLEVYSSNSVAYYGLGEIALEMNKLEEARNLFNQAANYSSTTDYAQDKINLVNEKLGLEFDENNIYTLRGKKFLIDKAEKAILDGDLSTAKNHLNLILEINPRYIEALNNLVVIQIMEGNIEEALLNISKIIDIDPENSTALENLKYLEENITVS